MEIMGRNPIDESKGNRTPVNGTIENAALSFLPCKGSPVSWRIEQGGPAGWLSGKKSSSLRLWYFFPTSLAQSRTRDRKAGKK